MGKTVLIVDDDSKNIFALSAVLRHKGFRTVTANDVKQGLSILQSDHDIGIVLSDVMMPGQDGFDLIRTIRGNQRTRDIPVVAVTAQAMTGDEEKCLAAGADAYISKPVNIEKLISILDKYEIGGDENSCE